MKKKIKDQRSIKVYDWRVDLWSAGCVVAEMLSGKVLFASRVRREEIKDQRSIKEWDITECEASTYSYSICTGNSEWEGYRTYGSSRGSCCRIYGSQYSIHWSQESTIIINWTLSIDWFSSFVNTVSLLKLFDSYPKSSCTIQGDQIQFFVIDLWSLSGRDLTERKQWLINSSMRSIRWEERVRLWCDKFFYLVINPNFDWIINFSPSPETEWTSQETIWFRGNVITQ